MRSVNLNWESVILILTCRNKTSVLACSNGMLYSHIHFQAKDALCQDIDNYIRDRIVVAGEVIQDTAGRKIKDDDVILTYAR